MTTTERAVAGRTGALTSRRNTMHKFVSVAALVLVAALPNALAQSASGATASGAAPGATDGFTGVCTISGTVIPFTDFAGAGTCTGTLFGETVVNAPVTAVATAVGTSVGPLPLNQTGEGTIVFTGAGRTIDFTFTQVLTTLVLTGTGGGSGLGEVVPLETSGAVRKAEVVATSVGLR